MTRLMRSGGVLVVMLLGLACGGGSMEEPTDVTAVDLASHSPAAHIVCDAEDPCGRGYICLGHVRCAKLCKTDSDCPTGQACTGQTGGKKFCQ